MTSFRAKLGQPVKRKHGKAAHAAKVSLRRRVFEAVQAGKKPVAVLDAFAGDGGMHRAVWREADHYVGCDLEWARDDRLAYVVDNIRLLRTLDLGRFNIFDFDAHGSPWTQAAILAQRRRLLPGERIGLVLTEGSGLKLRFNDMPGSMRFLTGVTGRIKGLARYHDNLIDRAISRLADLMGGAVTTRWQAQGKSGAKVIYIGLVIDGHKKSPDRKGRG